MFVLAIVLSIYWLATFIAFRGVGAFARVSKWGGIVGTIIPAFILIVLGFAYLIGGGKPQIDLAWKDLIPDFSNFNNVVLAAGIFLFYAGMEMNAIHVKEVSNPSRNYPIAILIASVGTVTIFVLGTLAIAFIIPKASINLTQSLLVAYFDMFKWAHIGWLAPVMAVALAIGVLAGIVTWVSGPSSGLLVVAKAGYMPRFWQHTNKHGMATHILLVQAILVTALSIMFVVLPSVQAAYQILSQLTVILYLVMYLLMFAAGIYLRFSQPNRPRPYKIPGGDYRYVVGRRPRLPRLAAGLDPVVHPARTDQGRKPDPLCRHPDRADRAFRRRFRSSFTPIRKPHWRDPAQRLRAVHLGSRGRPSWHSHGVGNRDRQRGRAAPAGAPRRWRPTRLETAGPASSRLSFRRLFGSAERSEWPFRRRRSRPQSMRRTRSWRGQDRRRQRELHSLSRVGTLASVRRRRDDRRRADSSRRAMSTIAFAIESISKVFTLALVTELIGSDARSQESRRQPHRPAIQFGDGA